MALTRKEISARYRARHLEKSRAADRAAKKKAREADPEKFRALCRAWKKANPDKAEANT